MRLKVYLHNSYYFKGHGMQEVYETFLRWLMFNPNVKNLADMYYKERSRDRPEWWRSAPERGSSKKRTHHLWLERQGAMIAMATWLQLYGVVCLVALVPACSQGDVWHRDKKGEASQFRLIALADKKSVHLNCFSHCGTRKRKELLWVSDGFLYLTWSGLITFTLLQVLKVACEVHQTSGGHWDLNCWRL